MRKLFLLVLFSVAMLLSANPMMPRAIQQIWFDDSGDFMLQIGHEIIGMGEIEFEISDGVNTINLELNLPDDYGLYPITINLSALMPDLNLSPESGFLDLNGWIMEEVRWGPSGDVDHSSLIATQSLYQSVLHPPNDDSALILWAKSDHPDFVTDYDSSTRSTITIYIKYPDGSPATNIPLYYQHMRDSMGMSNTEGKIELTLRSAKTNLRIFQPGTQELVFDETFFAEPAGCYVYNVILQPSSVSDEYQDIPRASLKLSPNVLKPGQKMQLDLGKSEANPDILRLFDVKGRIVGEYPFTESWQPPKLSSGVYFLQLLQGDSALDSVRFIMLK